MSNTELTYAQNLKKTLWSEYFEIITQEYFSNEKSGDMSETLESILRDVQELVKAHDALADQIGKSNLRIRGKAGRKVDNTPKPTTVEDVLKSMNLA